LFLIFFKLIKHGLLITAVRLRYNSNEIRKSELLEAFGQQICVFFMEMGPSFIKLGQFLSTRPDLVGQKICDKLTMLQDNLPPFPFSEVEKICLQEFGKPLKNIFVEIQQEPVAAASIAQVHKAKLISGTLVAVKVLRPDIAHKVRKDIKFFMFFARAIEKLSAGSKRLRLPDVVHKLEQTLSTEMDLRLEGAAADELRKNCSADKHVNVPKVFWAYSSEKILTIEWIDGTSINQKSYLQKANINRKNLVKKLAISFFNQAFRDGFFHADLHPGNVMVDSSGEIHLIDFGIMGVLDERSRIFIAEILYAFINRDYERVADIHFDVGLVPKHQSPHLFKLACRSIGEPIIGLPVEQISVGKLLKHLFAISHKFDMEIRPELLLLQKTMVTVEGIGYMIYPKVNMWQLAEPWIKQWARRNLGARAKLHKSAKEFSKIMAELPEALAQLKILLTNFNQQS
jgi:ubiquinone biosynthesis protein